MPSGLFDARAVGGVFWSTAAGRFALPAVGRKRAERLEPVCDRVPNPAPRAALSFNLKKPSSRRIGRPPGAKIPGQPCFRWEIRQLLPGRSVSSDRREKLLSRLSSRGVGTTASRFSLVQSQPRTVTRLLCCYQQNRLQRILLEETASHAGPPCPCLRRRGYVACCVNVLVLGGGCLSRIRTEKGGISLTKQPEQAPPAAIPKPELRKTGR